MSAGAARTPSAVYSPASQLRAPGAMFAAIWRDIKASRGLSWRLFVRDLSALYRQSLLGPFWTFVPPVVTSLIFVALRSANVVNLGSTDIPYPAYVVVGTILWQTFVESLNAPLKAVTAAKPMLAKINFPREALIVSALMSAGYGMLVKLVVMLGVLMALGLSLSWTTPLLALGPMLAIVLLGICLGLLLTPIGLLYTDVASGLPVATQILFFVTPVVYVPPQTFPFSLINTLNPASPLIIAARDLITKGAILNAEAFALVAGLSVVGLVVGLVVFRAAMPIFIERMSA